jgi:hypothetical protein
VSTFKTHMRMSHPATFLRWPASAAKVRMKKVLGSAILILVAVTGLAAGTLSSAQAAASKSVSFNKSWTFKSKTVGACVAYKVTGKITYTAVTNGHNSVFWSNQKLVDPVFTAKVTAYDGGSCIGPKTLTSISMSQHWAGYSCSFNPTLSVSAPFGLSFGGWPSCGSRTLAAHSTSYGLDSSYLQDNSGSHTSFENFTGSTSHEPCYGVYVSSTAHQGPGTSDSFSSSAKEVCLPAA